MDTDAKSESTNRRLNDLVAVTVVILTVFAAISKVKDDNINQAMQKAKSESVDAWAEYQAARIKLHVDENGLSTLRLLETTGQIDKTLAAKQTAEYESDIKKYTARSAETMVKAKALEAEYDRLNFRDDQFDMSDAFLSIAVALAAVAGSAATASPAVRSVAAAARIRPFSSLGGSTNGTDASSTGSIAPSSAISAWASAQVARCARIAAASDSGRAPSTNEPAISRTSSQVSPSGRTGSLMRSRPQA